jgi:hypothetical protein
LANTATTTNTIGAMWLGWPAHWALMPIMHRVIVPALVPVFLARCTSCRGLGVGT